MDEDDFYNSFGIDIKNIKQLKKHKLFNLYQIPKKIKNEAKTQDVDDNATNQADILFMPEDPKTKEKYALVVCDVGSRKTDAVPLKTKDSKTVLEAFKKIYARGIVPFPKYMIQMDAGTEFKNPVDKYFEDKNITVRVGKVGHHQAQASVEAKNYIIGRALHMRQAAEEMITGVVSKDWVEHLPTVITWLNKRLQRNNPVKVDHSVMPMRCSGDECKLLPENTRVRVMLDAPINVHDNSKLHGKFRASDIRWENDITTILRVLLRGDQPPLYLTAKYPQTPYHKEQLQVVPDDEQLPPEKIMTRFVVEKIVGKRKENNRIQYRIKWKGYGNNRNTWEPRTELLQDGMKEMIDEYEATL